MVATALEAYPWRTHIVLRTCQRQNPLADSPFERDGPFPCWPRPGQSAWRICEVIRSYGDELHELSVQLIAEEAVHLEWVVAIGAVNGAQDVEVDAMPPQRLPPAHYLLERSRSPLV